MAIENDPSRRMQVRTLGELMPPGQCMVCGSGNCDAGYVDFGVFFDYEGTMYICMVCGTELGETIGMFTKDQMDTQQSLMRTIVDENEKLKEELEDAKRTVGSLHYLSNSKFLSSIDSSLRVSEESESEQDDAQLSLIGTDEGESESEKSTPSLGPSDFSGFESRDLKFS